MRIELKELLVELLTQENLVGSWGLTQIKIGKTVVSFYVSGFKYKGRVQIKCHKEGYSIILGQTKREGVRLQDVVGMIDGEIEMSSDYFDKVAEWIMEN